MTRSQNITSGLVGLVLGMLAFICGINAVDDTYEFDGKEVRGGDHCVDLNNPDPDGSRYCRDVADVKETNVVGRVLSAG